MCDDDQDIWKQVSKTVSPLDPEKAHKAVRPKLTKKTAKPEPKKSSVPLSKEPQNLSFDTRDHSNIDRQTYKKLKRGDIQVEARLDLHGLNVIEAFDATNEFLLNAYNSGKRCVLVITGKGIKNFGNSPSRGILREKFPDWVEMPALKSKIIKIAPAASKHGGEGAFYVYLKKHK